MSFKGHNLEPLEAIPEGMLKNPLRWAEGHEVKAGYHYTDGTHIYVALEDGVPTGLEDQTYFTEV